MPIQLHFQFFISFSLISNNFVGLLKKNLISYYFLYLFSVTANFSISSSIDLVKITFRHLKISNAIRPRPRLASLCLGKITPFKNYFNKNLLHILLWKFTRILSISVKAFIIQKLDRILENATVSKT